jgi:hypothetical protein
VFKVETQIYFVQPEGGGLIKIGRADDPEQRLRILQIGSPVPLVLCSYHPAHLQMEGRLHSLFSKYRQHGEWFLPCPALAAIAGAIADPELTDDDMTPDKRPTDWALDHAWRRETLAEERAEAIRKHDEWRAQQQALDDADRVLSLPRLHAPLTALPDDVDPDWLAA